MTAPTDTTEKSLGDVLIEQGVISPLQLDESLQRQRLTGDMLGRVLVSMGHCGEQDIIEALGVQSGLERIDITKLKIEQDVLKIVSSDVARFYSIIPIRILDGDTLLVAMADPLNIQVLDDVRRITGMKVRGAVSNQMDVDATWKDNYSFESDSIQSMLKDLEDRVGTDELSLTELGQQEVVADMDNLVELAQQPEVIKIVNLVFLEAVKKRASDIHFEVYEEDFRIRIRIDGVLQEAVSPSKILAIALVSRVKILAEMDISERRLPQDARIELKVGDTVIDVRVSTLPTLFGECVVMRVLDRMAIKVDLADLGMPKDILVNIDDTIHKPNGMMLVTGPTGSGKTTTLYACLNLLNETAVKIITTEDPVEYRMDGLVQCQINDDIDLTFASCLRSILRQDPDIVMVGEIRDLETAQIAVEASLTGHLVLSTLHTNSAPETVTRLLDMDVEPFMITASLEGVLAQRLARKLCNDCSEKYRPDDEEMKKLALPTQYRADPTLRLTRAKGCVACDFVGYKGRIGLYEFLGIDEHVNDLVRERAMAMDIRKYARKELGMLTLRERAIINCLDGGISAKEAIAHTDSYDD